MPALQSEIRIPREISLVLADVVIVHLNCLQEFITRINLKKQGHVLTDPMNLARKNQVIVVGLARGLRPVKWTRELSQDMTLVCLHYSN